MLKLLQFFTGLSEEEIKRRIEAGKIRHGDSIEMDGEDGKGHGGGAGGSAIAHGKGSIAIGGKGGDSL